MSNNDRKGIFGGRWGLLGIALLFSITACSSESPTAPTPNPGGGGGGGTPPQGATVVVTASNPSPIVSSTSTITATVTLNGQPVPNGTAVEFSTTLGTFTDTADTTTLRTTTNGVATAVLTSQTPGQARVTVRVNNVAETVDVQFRVADQDPDPDGATITSVDPGTAAPAGGQIVTIRGTGFEAPVRVLFGDREATVVSVTATEIRVVVPAVTLGATEQARDVNIVVINNAGNDGEERLVAPSPFRYQIEVLTPLVYGVSPASGPREGNTRVVITGEGFQAPVKVYFGTGGGPGPLDNQVELEVIRVSYGQIEALTPPIWELYGTPDPGTWPDTLQVTLRVQNLGSNTDFVQAQAFRYGPVMAITAISPTQGPATGGTNVTIHGWGFDDPVAVYFGTVAVQPIRVSGSEIVVRTPALSEIGCASLVAPVRVVNVEDGAQATGDAFTFNNPQPRILNVSSDEVTEGSSVQIAVVNAGTPEFSRFRINGRAVTPTVVSTSGDITVFSVVIPTTLDLVDVACGDLTTDGPTPASVSFINSLTGCEVPASELFTILPQPTAVLVATPESLTLTPENQSGTFQLVNIGGGEAATGINISAPAGFTVTPGSVASLSQCAATTIAVSYTPTATAQSGTVTVTSTNAGGEQIAVTGAAAPPADPEE